MIADGAGHGGGVSLQATALDSRIKAVIAQVPPISGTIDALIYPNGLLDRAQKAIENSAGKATPPQEYIQLFPNTKEESEDPNGYIIGGQLGWGFYSFVRDLPGAAESNWENKVTLESAYYNYAHEFKSWIPRIAPRPLLYIAPGGSMFPTNPHKELFEGAAAEGGELRLIEPFDFSGYILGHSPENVRTVEVEWLKKVLA